MMMMNQKTFSIQRTLIIFQNRTLKLQIRKTDHQPVIQKDINFRPTPIRGVAAGTSREHGVVRVCGAPVYSVFIFIYKKYIFI